MKLREIIEYVDGVMPNAYTGEEKTQWLNELEQAIQIDVFRRRSGLTDHVWESEWRGRGVYFPDTETVVIPGRLEARAGGEILITGLTTEANNRDGLRVLAASVSDEATVLTFDEGTFTQQSGADTAEASVMYDGGPEDMLLPEPWRKLYHAWLRCRLCEASGEYTKYANELQAYNNLMGQYQRWYARTYIDDDEEEGEPEGTEPTGGQSEKVTPGPAGPGVAAGGTTGQVLAKKSGTDYDTEWVDQEEGGAVESVNGKTGTVVLDAEDVGAYELPVGGIPKTDLASDVQTSLGKADTALQSYTETDPTVPSWAKQSSKPSYSANEVGAIAAPSSPGTGDFLCWNGSAWVATSMSAWQGGNY